MGKFKAVKKGGKPLPAKPGAIPCAVLILCGIALLSLLFYQVLSSAAK